LPRLIFTLVWALELETEGAYIEQVCGIFREKGADVYFVELDTDLSERLRRNESEFRLSQKPSKRDVEKSRKRLLEDAQKHKLNSDGSQALGKISRFKKLGFDDYFSRFVHKTDAQIGGNHEQRIFILRETQRNEGCGEDYHEQKCLPTRF
jgi:hypothetical protein